MLSDVLVACPACVEGSLVAFETREGVRVEFCQRCKGMLIDEAALERLTGSGDVRGVSELCDEPAQGAAGSGLGPCLRCNTIEWQRRSFGAGGLGGLGLCGTCGMLWLEAGGLERLRERLLSERRRARNFASGDTPTATDAPFATDTRIGTTPALATPPIRLSGFTGIAVEPPDLGDPPDRISFDRGVGNVVGVPLALALSVPFCLSSVGGFFAGLIGMPFHELGHALASWLSSRIAVPLPFFTVWQQDQSLGFGLTVAGLIGWFGYHSWREGRRFGVGVALVLLSFQLGLSWGVATQSTLMLQILGGALGELVLGALLLAAFHFPLPDRLRWDFWRWPTLLPGAVCFTHALLLWARAAGDASLLPWGAAIGDDSDGDMNRLVRDFGWSATTLASFYLKAGGVSALGIVGAYAFAWRRYRRELTRGRWRCPSRAGRSLDP